MQLLGEIEGLPRKWTDQSVILRFHPITAFWTLLLTMMATPFLLRGSCHSSSWYDVHLNYIHPFLSILAQWFLKCWCSFFPSPVWPLSIYLDSWTLHSRLLHNIALHSIRLLPSLLLSTTEHCFCFGSISSFFLELFFHSSPLAYWASTYLGSSSFIVISFCLFALFMGFSWQEYWSGLPFPSPVDHVLSELSTITCPSWVALHDKAHSSFELDKAVVHVISLISFLWLCLIDFHSAFPLMNKDKRLMAVSW